MGIKIISLNIEGDKHLPEVIGLIERERPEVVCLQEVFKEDFKLFVKKFGMRGIFLPTVLIDRPVRPGYKKTGIFGIAMLGTPSGEFGSEYYFKKRSEELPRYRMRANPGHQALIWQEIIGGPTIASTHFTWSKGGRASQRQRNDLKKLIKLLTGRVKPDVLCGDFNAPRGGEIWAGLAEKMIDNIPANVKTTLDPRLHYANGVELVVDGLFTAAESKFKVKSIKLIGGVSDHLAIAAELS